MRKYKFINLVGRNIYFDTSILKLANLHKADVLLYLFDESLSGITQTTEMDFYVRY